MKCISRQEYADAFETRYRPLGAFMDARVVVAASGATLRECLSIDPDDEWHDGDPGPLNRWYGECNGLLYVVESPASPHLHHAVIVLPDGAKLGYTCVRQMLVGLSDSGLFSLGAIVWIKSDTEMACSAVTYIDEYGIKWEVYRAPSQADAEAMYSFLLEQSPAISYRIEPAEDVRSTWVVDCLSDEGPGSVLARYTSRSATEQAARDFSLRDNALYSVRREDAAGVGLAFRCGKVVQN